MKVLLLSAVAVSALITLPTRAATITVTDQSEFDAAILQATQAGHTDTIDATAAGTIDAGTSLTLPAAATSVNLEFSSLAIGASGTGNETVTLGAGTTVSFEQVAPATLNMGSGNTGTLNINGASLIFNITTQGSQFNIGLDGGNGIVNMTAGAVTINDSNATPGVFGSISIGYPFGITAAHGTFNQSGGVVSVSAGALNVGIANGVGTYKLTGTALLEDRGATVYIGASTGGVGKVNISGNATVDLESISAGASGQLYVGDDLGVGTITQNGANSTVILNVINIAQFGSNASSGPSLGGTGTYNLIAGTLEIGGLGAAFGMDVGGIGIFNQSGGSLTANAPIFIGMSGTGTYNLSGGSATLNAGLTIASLAGSVGSVNQTGGTLTISGGSLSLGGAGTATYDLNGGALQVGGANGIVGAGPLNFGGGTLQVIGSALTTNVDIGLTGANSAVDTNGLSATFGGVMSGTGGFTKSGLGALDLTGANTFSGGATLSAGTLQVGVDTIGAPGAITASAIGTGTLTFNGGTLQAGGNGYTIANAAMIEAPGGKIDSNGNLFTYSGNLTGAGALSIVSSVANGTVILSGVSSYSGATLVRSGSLEAGSTTGYSPNSAFQVGGGATLLLNGNSSTIASLADGTGGGTVQNGAATAATLTLDTASGTTTFSGTLADGGGGTLGLVKTAGGRQILTGASSYTGGTTIAAGTLQLGNGGATGSIVGTVTDNGILAVDRSDTVTFAGAISGAGAFQQIGTGTDVLTGTGTYTGGTTIAAGTLQLGDGGAAGSIVGNVTDHGVLAFDRSDTVTFAGAISGAGAFQQIGGGTVLLTGASSYTGATTIASGVLQVDGSLGDTAVTVGDGAVLKGTGSIAGGVTVARGGTLAPGDAPGTITLGSLTLNTGSLLAYQLGKANVVGGPTNDLTVVTGALTINGGTLNVTNSGGFGLGAYRIFNYGTLDGSGRIAVGTLPNGETGVIQTAIPGQINLIVNGPGTLVQFWDGATTTGDGTIHGGGGTWNGTATNWTAPNGQINASWQSGFAVFAGAAGTVTVTGPIAYQGLQFSTDFYVLTAAAGGTLAPTGMAEIRVEAGMTATIAAPIIGAGGVHKTDRGTLILSGQNSYSGGTSVATGILRVTNAKSVGSGAVTLAGGTFQAGANRLTFANRFDLGAGGGTIDSQADMLTLTGAVGGAAALTKIGSGQLTLTGTSTYSGGTIVDAGTLGTGSDTALGSGALTLHHGTTLAFVESGVSIANTIRFPDADPTIDTGVHSDTISGAISGPGGFAKTGTGTMTLTGTDSYTGVTTIADGTLQVDGSLANSAVTVDPGAALGGSGAVGNIAIGAGATLAPGLVTPFSRLTVAHALSFAAGSTYFVNVNAAGATDSIAAGGAVTLAGGTVMVHAAPGAYAPSTLYTILSAAGGVDGRFAGVTTNFAFLAPSLSYSADDVFLTLTRNGVSFASVGATPNQRAVAVAAGVPGSGNAVFNTILDLTAPQARGAFDALSGEIHASAVSGVFEDARLPREAVFDRLDSPYGLVPPSGPDGDPAAPWNLSFWGQGFGSSGQIGGNGNAATLNRSLDGFIVGADASPDPGYRIGVVGGYTDSRLTLDQRISSGSIESFFGGFYGGAALARSACAAAHSMRSMITT